MNDDKDEYDTGKSCMDLESEESTLAATKRRRAQIQKGSKDRKQKMQKAKKRQTSPSLFSIRTNSISSLLLPQSIAAGGLVRKSGKWSKVMFDIS